MTGPGRWRRRGPTARRRPETWRCSTLHLGSCPGCRSFAATTEQVRTALALGRVDGAPDVSGGGARAARGRAGSRRRCRASARRRDRRNRVGGAGPGGRVPARAAAGPGPRCIVLLALAGLVGVLDRAGHPTGPGASTRVAGCPRATSRVAPDPIVAGPRRWSGLGTASVRISSHGRGDAVGRADLRRGRAAPSGLTPAGQPTARWSSPRRRAGRSPSTPSGWTRPPTDR